MNEEQYRALCEACDQALLAPDSTLERIAIPWLHVIREHPVFLVNYIDIFKSDESGGATFQRWRRALRSRAAWLRQLSASLHSGAQPWHGPEELSHDIDFLFVSHLLNASQNGRSEDFYFGELPHQLKEMGHSVRIALINHSGQAASKLAAGWKGISPPRVIFSGSLRFWEEAALYFRLRKESLRLRKISKKGRLSLSAARSCSGI